MKTILLSISLLLISFSITAQEIDPDTGQVIDQEEVQKQKELENKPTKKEKKELKNKNKVVDRIVKIKSRHKPFRIRTGFGNTEFGDLDIEDFPTISSYQIGVDFPTFTLYKELFIGINTFISINELDEKEADVGVLAVYGGSLTLNYSVKIVEGLYIVPLVGYGYITINESSFNFDDEIDPDVGGGGDITFENDTGFDIDDSSKTYINYGVYLDFSFNLRPKGLGITAGYSFYDKFTFGIQYGL